MVILLIDGCWSFEKIVFCYWVGIVWLEDEYDRREVCEVSYLVLWLLSIKFWVISGEVMDVFIVGMMLVKVWYFLI